MTGLTIPLRIVSLANKREHWSARARRAKLHRQGVHLALFAWMPVRPTLPCVVTLTRIAPRELDDDNLSSGCKSARDGIADWFGIDDRDKRVTWRYAQTRGKVREYGVRIEFEPIGAERDFCEVLA